MHRTPIYLIKSDDLASLKGLILMVEDEILRSQMLEIVDKLFQNEHK